MIDKNLFLENKIQKRYLRKKIINRFNKKCSSILQNLMVNFDKPNQTLNTLSKKFKLNFNLKDLKKFQKFNTLVIVGMGGSILGTEAIYEFLKQKIKLLGIDFFVRVYSNDLNYLPMRCRSILVYPFQGPYLHYPIMSSA